MCKKLFLILFIFVLLVRIRAEEACSNFYVVTTGSLASAKAKLANNDEGLKPALKYLVSEADKILHKKAPSVLDKNKTPPSGDKHDYMSVAPYYWPDPAKPDGLPYIRHDGKVNPTSREESYDHGRMQEMGESVETLCLAYYFTGNQVYAEQASKYLHTWFLDSQTRMNPNLNYAQAVPGENTGRGTGILEGRHVARAADAAQLLPDCPSWNKKDRADFKAWLEAYLDWLLTSTNGRSEFSSKNNHGTFYDVQSMELALVLGKNDVARHIAETVKTKRIGIQITPEGKQPLELERTAALGYSHFNLEALFTLATMSEYVGVDLWHCRLQNNKFALSAALDYLMPYVISPRKKWPFEQIKTFRNSSFAPQLRQAAIIYHEPRYEMAIQGFSDIKHERFQLLYSADLQSSIMLDVGEFDRHRILTLAKDALAVMPITITKFHAEHSIGGSNDFYSNADYWWPDASKSNGLPFIQHDGETNPNNFNEHRIAMRQMRDAVAALGAAYKITRDERYAQKAVQLLQIFFLDETTRMNPSLQYAQAVPGRDNGRGFGIIDGLHLIEVPQAIAALEGSSSMTKKIEQDLKKWFADLAQWMVTSKNGKDESTTKNNHAVAFWLQVGCYSRFTGDELKMAECRRQFKEIFVPSQMAIDGSFPLELKRTKPYAYSLFQLDNLSTLCHVLSIPADNLWSFELTDGRSMRRAVEYMYPYMADKTKWPLKPDVMAWNGWPARQSDLLFAGIAFNEQKYLELWKKLPPDPTDAEVRRTIPVTQPVLWVETKSFVAKK
jgi:hypothetical protein